MTRSHTKQRDGYTLLEVLLALAVLVTLVTIVWPSVTRMYEDYQLKDVTNDLRVQMAATRMLALNEGITYQFRFEPEGRFFVAIPSEYRMGSSAEEEDSQTVEKLYGELPEGLKFKDLRKGINATEKIDELWLEGMANANELSGKSWSQAMYFHPDGTASHAQFQVVDQNDLAIKVSIRGLSGAIKTSKVEMLKK